MIINQPSFIVERTEANAVLGAIEHGSVEVTLGRETQRVPAIRFTHNGSITAYGMSGRYRTGGKAWPAHVSLRDGREHIWFGRDDRASKFRKADGLFFAK